jgi:hypothetical protein
MDELKPCPFCGGEAKVIDAGIEVWVECTNEKCKCIRYFKGTRKEAYKAWNTRATPTDDQWRAPERDAGLPTNYDVSLALKISRYLHDLWPDAPHDIGIRVAEIVWLNNGQGT